MSGRILGVDYGSHRVGFAVSDPTQLIASAHAMVEVQDPGHAANETARIATEVAAVRIVVGLPLNMNGSRGPAAEKVEQFIERLRGKTGIPVATWDERLTTKSAHDVLIESGARRSDRKQLVDKIAAQIMLQNCLDAHSSV